MTTMTIIVPIIVATIALAVAAVAARAIIDAYRVKTTIWDYQVGLHFKHGRLVDTLASGKHVFWGNGHVVVPCDIRRQELVVQGQELLTADKATVKITSVLDSRGRRTNGVNRKACTLRCSSRS